MFGTPDTSVRRSRWALVAAGVFTLAVVAVIAASVDGAALAAAWQRLLGDPTGVALAVGAFAAAFLLRAVVWTRVLPGLSLGHSWAALHVALAGNHLFPLRLGEPLRVVSVVRRAGIGWREAAASTLSLRAADVAALAAVGGTAAAVHWSGAVQPLILVLGIAGAVAVAGWLWMRRLRSDGAQLRLPGAGAVLAVAAAWGLEAVVVWQSARWVGVPLEPSGALLVSAAAVVAQLAAVAPGGFGTYEGGGVAAMVALGQDPGAALAVVLTAHAVKTAYSLLVGGVAVLVPEPGFFGRLRVARHTPPPPPPGGAPPPRPVVLFLPAHNEEASVGEVVRRTPRRVGDHPVRVLVVDDGSTDRTAEVAEQAGAEVVRLGRNRGLGAAVRVGLGSALALEPAAVAFCDADGEYAPEELERLVAPILAGAADYVVGSRFRGRIDRMLPHRRLGNRVLTAALSWVSRRRISDGQSGYRAFSPQAAAAAEVIHDFNYAQVLTLDLLAKGYRYAEVPISYSFRTTGRSFIRLGPYLRRVVPAVVRELNT